MKTATKLYTENRKKPISFENLQKIKFKPFGDLQVEYSKELFRNTDTKIVIDC